jgi:hypothetical protein
VIFTLNSFISIDKQKFKFVIKSEMMSGDVLCGRVPAFHVQTLGLIPRTAEKVS